MTAHNSSIHYLRIGLLLCAAFFLAAQNIHPLAKPDNGKIEDHISIKPLPSFFPSLPVHLIGETVDTGEYSITLEHVTLQYQTLSLTINLKNQSSHEVDLNQAVQVYLPTYELLPRPSLPPEENKLAIGETIRKDFTYDLSGSVVSEEELMDFRLLYAPFGWSGPVILYRLSDTAPQQTVEPSGDVQPQAYGATGDPWKMLVLIYPNIDTYYMEGGVQKRLTASMPAQDIENMKNDFLNLPHQNIVHAYSNGTAELETHVIVVNRPLTNLEPIGEGYWPSPDVTRQELDLYAPKGKYDSVMIFWQASHPTTGQSLPTYGWGLGYWPFEYANGMTYATVFNLSWVWPNDACQGEVFLHEWLHGVTGFYMWRGFQFPFEDLHGAEEAGYVQDANGCWKDWLKDYMRGLVYENGVRKALVTQTWHGGSITTYNIQGWRGEYYNNETLYGTPTVIRNDPTIDFFWELGSPHPLINADHFSVRWTKTINFNEGLYRFDLTRDDGLRLWVDNTLILDSWYWGFTDETIEHYISGGEHNIRLETYEIDGWSSAKLLITPLSYINGPDSTTTTLTSTASHDGHVLESAETSNAGGTQNSKASTFFLGDDAANKQYRAILSFNTTLPSNATITKVTLKIKNAGMAGTNPFSTHGKLLVDVRKGAFSNNNALQLGDFNAAASKSSIGSIPKTLSGGWYTKVWTSGIFDYINKAGVTQFRLRFAKDDNNDLGADYLKIYSGNAGATSRPQLIIEYYVP